MSKTELFEQIAARKKARDIALTEESRKAFEYLNGLGLEIRKAQWGANLWYFAEDKATGLIWTACDNDKRRAMVNLYRSYLEKPLNSLQPIVD